jgi:hypothetical protein
MFPPFLSTFIFHQWANVEARKVFPDPKGPCITKW